VNKPHTKSFNYAVGMFGTSIPINMLKTYAAYYYVDSLGVTTAWRRACSSRSGGRRTFTH
jgi:hypothetical protein